MPERETQATGRIHEPTSRRHATPLVSHASDWPVGRSRHRNRHLAGIGVAGSARPHGGRLEPGVGGGGERHPGLSRGAGGDPGAGSHHRQPAAPAWRAVATDRGRFGCRLPGFDRHLVHRRRRHLGHQRSGARHPGGHRPTGDLRPLDHHELVLPPYLLDRLDRAPQPPPPGDHAVLRQTGRGRPCWAWACLASAPSIARASRSFSSCRACVSARIPRPCSAGC